MPTPSFTKAAALPPQLKAGVAQKGDKLKVNRFNTDQDVPTSILLYGKSRSGKSKAIADLLECRSDGTLAESAKDGLKIVCLNTDLGGEAATVETIKNTLDSRGKIEFLRENFVSIPSEAYLDTVAFLNDPTESFPDIWSFNPDMIVWEGFSSFQLNQIDEYVLTQEDRAEIKDDTGLRSGRQDWGSIYRATRRALQKFINLASPTGKPLHKFMTCLEATSSGDYGTATGSAVKTERGPLLDGKAKAMIAPSFSLVLISRLVTEGKETVYKYQTRGDDGMIAGTRGHALQAMENADMREIWKKIRS